MELREVIPSVKEYVLRRIEEFRELGEKGRTRYDFSPFLDLKFEAGIFSELCFCLLTANFSAVVGLKIQAELGDEGFMELSYDRLTDILSKHGHRFAGQRARRIVEARQKFPIIQEALRREKNSKVLRDMLSRPDSTLKVNGFGYKEASHFLRNVGREDVAIIDRHVRRFLVERGMMEEVKTLTRKRYLEAEGALRKLGEELGLSHAELDLYIFYLKTKKVLK